MWHPVVTCERCGYQHHCVRLVSGPCVFDMLCHGCECLLVVAITGGDLQHQRKQGWDAEFHVVGMTPINRT